jgi:hypothetical protein
MTIERSAEPLTDLPLTGGPISILGALDLERTAHGLLPHRLPPAARAQFPEDALLQAVEAQPSGVRLVFRTAASVVELDVLPGKVQFLGSPPRPACPYDLLVDGRLTGQASVEGGRLLQLTLGSRQLQVTPGPPGTVRFGGLPAGMKDVEIWLPHLETVELIAVRADAPAQPATEQGRPRWLHHGSSISHGESAVNPTGTWPAVAAAVAGVDLLNLGLAGNALLDPFTARAIRDTAADLISVKLGINVVNADAFRFRTFGPAVHGFLDTIREGHPRTPLLVVSPIFCEMAEDIPGPSGIDLDAPTLRFRNFGDPADVAAGKLTLRVIRDELRRIVGRRAGADPNLHYLDGLELYGPADAGDLPLPDDLHPGPEAHRRIGERFARLALGPSGPLRVS